MLSEENSPLVVAANSMLRARSLMSIAGTLIASGKEAGIRQAVALASEAIQIWQQLLPANLPDTQRSLSMACLLKANALRETGDPVLRADALLAYEETLQHFQVVMDQSDPADANQMAKIWMCRGMTLLDDGRPSVLGEALNCFDRALDLRKSLPLETEWRYVWALSAAWLNRGDVLTRLGGAENLAESIRSYDEAIPLLTDMPMEEYPTCRARLALAWMNRGLACQAQENPESLEEAIQSYGFSIATLTEGGDHGEQRRILACARLNRGHALLNRVPADPVTAREDALAALALAIEFEKQEVLAAQVSLQSRHLLCRAMAHLMDSGEVPADWLEETTDAVDEGMALARYWRQLGETRLRELEGELFRFGALIYRLCQPHFLAEFLLDNLDPERSPGVPVADGNIHHLATEALWSLVMDIRARQQAGPAASETEGRLLSLLEELQETEKRLQALREQYLGGSGKNNAT